MKLFKAYYQLAKPGIIYGNLMTTVAGFLLASKGHVDWGLLLATASGVALVMASACALNNYIDRDVDAKMSRTKKRALVTGALPITHAIIYSAALGLAGFLTLGLAVNFLVVILGIIAWTTYIVFYGLAKRLSVHGTLVGTVAGAMPPAAGYCAVSGHFDSGAFILFLILVFWQMPHFYAIAMFRLEDYKAAGIPVLPLMKGLNQTKAQINLYIMAFIVACASLTLFGYTGLVYLVISFMLGALWLRKGLKAFYVTDSVRWARGMFFFSLLVLTILSATIALDAWLP